MAKDSASHSILNSATFTSLTKEAMCKIKDVHSWRFYFACGVRKLLVGLGVSVAFIYVCVSLYCALIASQCILMGDEAAMYIYESYQCQPTVTSWYNPGGGIG